MMRITIILTTCLAAFCCGALFAIDKDTPGKKVDRALDKAKETADDVKDKVKNKKDKMKDALDKAKDKIFEPFQV